MNEIRYITRFDRDYPQRLNDIPNPPGGIYVKGKLPDPDKKAVAIIGSRICSLYGSQMAQKFASELSKEGVVIISGLARGIDGIAQQSAAMSGGETFGVLGSGIDIVYPKENGRIFDMVLEKGGLISEYGPGICAQPFMFVNRNRIISALSDIVLVVEAKKRSGTLITVSNALEQGKDVYAVPGRIYDECSMGCNELIDNGAGMALSTDTILNALGIIKKEDTSDIRVMPELSDEERLVYKLLETYPKDVEYFIQNTGFALSKIFEILIRLQLKGMCKDIGQNNYIRIN